MSKGILVIGDLHGNWSSLNKLIQQKEPSIVLQCGDFGWWPKMEVRKATVYRQKQWALHGLKLKDTIVHWCDGNHEDHEDLDGRGRATKDAVFCYDGVLYQPRGSVLRLPDGRRVLFYGGAKSIDKNLRTPGFDWFEREIPSATELDKALGFPGQIDIVISHTCPKSWDPDPSKPLKCLDPTRYHLQEILEKYKPSLWYHGHWHKEASGQINNTNWISLDYPGHGGRWWCWLPSV